MTGALLRAYAALLRLYPRTFYAEFAAEMHVAFADAAADAPHAGSRLWLFLRELTTLPACLLRAHLDPHGKELTMISLPSDRHSTAVAWRSAAGFALAFALLGLGYLLLISRSNPLSHLGTSLAWIACAALAGATGGTLLDAALSAGRRWRFGLAGAAGFAAAVTLLPYPSLRIWLMNFTITNLVSQFDTTTLLAAGALTGALAGWALGNARKALLLALVGGAAFPLGMILATAAAAALEGVIRAIGGVDRVYEASPLLLAGFGLALFTLAGALGGWLLGLTAAATRSWPSALPHENPIPTP